jgi:hypothetical protein
MLTLLLASPRETVTVYAVTEGQLRVALPANQLGRPADIAYDPTSQSILVYTWDQERWHVRKWSMRDKLIADWQLPVQLQPDSALHQSGGRLCALAYDADRKKYVIISFGDHPPGRLSVEDSRLGPLEYDRSLDPNTVEPIRRIMKELRWSPALHPEFVPGGFDGAGPPSTRWD